MAQATLPAAVDLESQGFELSSGHAIPAVGLGTWESGSGSYPAVRAAIVEAGYRHIDTAWQYNVLNKRLGMGSSQQCKQELIGRIFSSHQNFGIECTELLPDGVRTALNNTLQELQLDYLDLYLIHWPFCLKDGSSRPPEAGEVLDFDMEGVWREMERLVKDNLVRDIGVCNFTLKKLNKLLEFAETMPSVCQMEMHPGWRNDKMLEFCKKNSIHVTAHSPLGSSEGGRDLIHDKTVEKIARKLNKSPGQVLARWALQRGTSAIPKSTHPDRIQENGRASSGGGNPGATLPNTLQHPRSVTNQGLMAWHREGAQRRVLDGEELFVNKEAGPFRSVADLWDYED